MENENFCVKKVEKRRFNEIVLNIPMTDYVKNVEHLQMEKAEIKVVLNEYTTIIILICVFTFILIAIYCYIKRLNTELQDTKLELHTSISEHRRLLNENEELKKEIEEGKIKISAVKEILKKKNEKKIEYKYRTLTGKEDDGREFTRPQRLAVCPCTDQVYLTDFHTQSIYVFDINGKRLNLKRLTVPPRDITINNKGHVIVVNPYYKPYGTIFIYDQSLEYISSFSKEGAGDGELTGVRGLVCDKKDNIYVVDYGNNRVSVFNPDGSSFLRHIGAKLLKCPSFIQISQNDELIVDSNEPRRVFVFRLRDGECMRNIDVGPATALCMTSLGYLFVANNDDKYKQIKVFPSKCEHLLTIANVDGTLHDMHFIAITKQKRLFVADEQNKKLHILQLDHESVKNL